LPHFRHANPQEFKLSTLLLEEDEGELRTRRIHTDSSSPASSQFMLKVSPQNNGSQHLVAGTELLAPGATLPKHRHLVQDEILLIQSGTAHVWLGEEERDHARATERLRAPGAFRERGTAGRP